MPVQWLGCLSLDLTWAPRGFRLQLMLLVTCAMLTLNLLHGAFSLSSESTKARTCSGQPDLFLFCYSTSTKPPSAAFSAQPDSIDPTPQPRK
jgi:hypothetical protein